MKQILVTEGLKYLSLSLSSEGPSLSSVHGRYQNSHPAAYSWPKEKGKKEKSIKTCRHQICRIIAFTENTGRGTKKEPKREKSKKTNENRKSWDTPKIRCPLPCNDGVVAPKHSIHVDSVRRE